MCRLACRQLELVAAGKAHNVVLLTTGAVQSWGANENATNVPTSSTRAGSTLAVAAGSYHSLALSNNGTVAAWGSGAGTNVPSGLSDVVAIAAGGSNSLALIGSNGMGGIALGAGPATNVPVGLSDVMGIAVGSNFGVGLLNTGALVAWEATGAATNLPSTTSPGSPGSCSPPRRETRFTPPPIIVKSIAVGGYHAVAAISSPLVQYPVDVSKDLLLIYNTNCLDSSNALRYYTNNRPMVANANILGIGLTTNTSLAYPTDYRTNQTFDPYDYTNLFLPQLQTWLSNNPTKRPGYVVLMQNIPGRVNGQYWTGINSGLAHPSVQYQLHFWCMTNWYPFITSLNMNELGGTNATTAYMEKICSFASNSPNKLFISASLGGYEATNWCFEWANTPGSDAALAADGVLNFNPLASITGTAYPTILTNG